MEEIWKDIPGYEGRYQVSNLGIVKSLSRWVKNRSGGYFTKDKILKVGKNETGYCVIGLRKTQSTKKLDKIFIHKAIMHAFNGVEDKDVHHIDGDRSNNIIGNLMYLSRSEHALAHHDSDTFVYYHKSTDRYEVRFINGDKSMSVYSKTKEEALCKKVFLQSSGYSSVEGLRKKPEYISYVKSRDKYCLYYKSKFIGHFKTKQETLDKRKEVLGY